MKRRLLTVILCAIMTLSLLLNACGKAEEIPATSVETSDNLTEETPTTSIETSENVTDETLTESDESGESITDESEDSDSANIDPFSVNLEGITTIDELEARINEVFSEYNNSLQLRASDLITEIDSYDKYCQQSEKVSEFYTAVEEETNLICIMLREYVAAYVRMILDSNMAEEDKADAVEKLQKFLDQVPYDVIMVMDNMYNQFYCGILADEPDSVEYDEWKEVLKAEYKQWDDTYQVIKFRLLPVALRDVSSFTFDMLKELRDNDLKRAERVYNQFLNKTDRRKNKGNDAVVKAEATFDTTIRNASSLEELDKVVDEQLSECVQALNKEWDDFSPMVDTYEKYCNHVDEVEHFYKHIEESGAQMHQMISRYAVVYANMIMEADSSSRDKYKDMSSLSDCIYENACDYIRYDIHDDLFSEMENFYFEGIFKDAENSVDSSEWHDTRKPAYDLWYDTHSYVNAEYHATRDDIFEFWQEMKSALDNDDIDAAANAIQKFEEQIGRSTVEVPKASEASEASEM